MNFLVQVATLIAAVAFGVYAVKSVAVGDRANDYSTQALSESKTANQLSMVALCLAAGNQVRLLRASRMQDLTECLT